MNKNNTQTNSFSLSNDKVSATILLVPALIFCTIFIFIPAIGTIVGSFYTTSKIISQSLFLFFYFRGGWAPRSRAQLIRVCDIIVLYIMGYYVITSLIKERINICSNN